MKPYIICHMMASVDGRIDCAMTEQIDSSDAYYEALESLDCPTTIEGRVTMQMHYALPEPFTAASKEPIGHTAFSKASGAGRRIAPVGPLKVIAVPVEGVAKR